MTWDVSQIGRSFFEAPPAWNERALEKTLAGGALLLIGVTWRLWVPQYVFPQVPLWGFAREWPVSFEWSAAAVLAAALAVALLAVHSGVARGATAAAALAMLGLIAVDQLRLQAWAWQFLLFALAWIALPPATAWGWMRLLAISLYFFSGVSKLNGEFLETLGPRFVEQGLSLVGVSMAGWSPGLRTAVVLLLPVGELAVAGCLAWPRARRAGVVAAVLLHASLLVILGPWGMKHSAGVLIWNVLFAAEVVLLFGPWGFSDAGDALRGVPSAGEGAASSGSRNATQGVPYQFPALVRRVSLAIQTALALACLLPALEPWGYWDTWPSWGLYSARNARTEVYLHERDAAILPGSIRRLLDDTPDEDGYVRLRIDRWCLDALGVPISPQPRQQLGVALAISERFPLKHPLRVVQVGPAGYLDRTRARIPLEGAELAGAAGQFWFNALPRGNLQRRIRD